MSATTAVYLITGFLGSGKTTFLNRVVKAFPKDRKLMILMNEFGDIGVDGLLIEDDDLAVLEISKGSIFCVCVKTDFIKGLMNIARTIQPEVLIIEATGVANPADLKRDLKISIFQNRFQFKEQFCLVDAEFFEETYDVFAAVEKQIESATVFIVNKVDRVDAVILDRVRQIIAAHHPAPDIHETAYAQIPIERYVPEICQKSRPAVDEAVMEAISPEVLDDYIDTLLAAPGISMTPPDRLQSVSRAWRGRGRQQFEAAVAAIPTGIVRAKGVVRLHGGTYLFNYVMGRSDLTEVAARPKMTALIDRIVFIGPPESIEHLVRVNFLDEPG
jgi:G3E family GTPase